MNAAMLLAGCLVIGSMTTGCSGDTQQPNQQPDPQPPHGWQAVEPELAAQFQSALENARAEQGLPGVAMAVAYRDTQQMWVSATGYADLPSETPWLATDEFRIGSVTKTFTAALTLRLVEEGLLSLDDPIEMWVPGWYSGPTIEQLLSHTSGIVSYNYADGFDESAQWTPQELLDYAYADNSNLLFPPGTQWVYSNTNYVYLGLVIEAVTGSSYRDALNSWLFDPTNLSETRMALSGDDSPSLVHSYDHSPPVDNTASADPSYGWAAGAIVSTPQDLACWTVALYGGDLLAQGTLAQMTTPNGVTGADEEDYGLGTVIENGSDDSSEHTLLGHTGGIAGYQTSAYYLRERNVALIVMANHRLTDLRVASSHGWAAILGIPYP